MRNIPVELVTRYEEAGWWTRETLGQVLAGGLHAAPDAQFRVYSDVRPWSGTFRDVEHVARRLAAGLRARGVGAGEFGRTTYQPDLCFGIDQIALVGRDFDMRSPTKPMTGTIAADLAGTTLIALISGTTRASKD
jgi:hypothetical protein